MKKISTLLVGMAICSLSFGQAVVDNSLIPVSITLNGILRMNVTAGGNINFKVNTLDQYEHGISNTAASTTTFTVASSTNFNVSLYAEDAAFLGTDNIGAVAATVGIPLNMVAYQVTANGTNNVANTNVVLLATATGVGNWQALKSSAAPESIILPGVAGNAGDINVNNFSVLWELGTTNCANATDGTALQTLKGGNYAADRYSTNVMLTLTGL